MATTTKHIASVGVYQYPTWDGIETINMASIINDITRNFSDKVYRNVKFTQGHQGGWIDQDPNLILGNVSSLNFVDGKLMADIEMDQKAQELIENGKLTDVSIGFFKEYTDNQGVNRGATLFEVALVAEGFLKTDPFILDKSNDNNNEDVKFSDDSNFRKDNMVFFTASLASPVIESLEGVKTENDVNISNDIKNSADTKIEPTKLEDVDKKIPTDAISTDDAKENTITVDEVTKEVIEETKKQDESKKETEVKSVEFSAINQATIELAQLREEKRLREVKDFAESFLLSRGGKLTEKFQNPIFELAKKLDKADWVLLSDLIAQIEPKFTENKITQTQTQIKTENEKIDEIIAFAKSNNLSFHEAKRKLNIK